MEVAEIEGSLFEQDPDCKLALMLFVEDALQQAEPKAEVTNEKAWLAHAARSWEKPSGTLDIVSDFVNVVVLNGKYPHSNQTT